jgi:hypothetical protein
MFRRVLLTLAFVGALGAVGFGVTNAAEAHGYRRGCDYYGGYGGYGDYYGGYYPYVYRSSYYPPAYYGPPVYRSYYGGYGGHRHYRDRGGVYFSIGF